MQKDELSGIFKDWEDEINESLIKNNSICLALFSSRRELIYANSSMTAFFKNKPDESLLNPSFDKILKLDYTEPLIFEGYLTLGDNSLINHSIRARIYRKENKLLIIGGLDANQLLEQNKKMHQLNHKIIELERQLIKEKHNLEKALITINNANNELKDLNASKDKFISILAHDLRSPFNAMLGFLDLLSSNLYEYNLDQIQSHLNLVNRSAKNTFSLLEDILLWARADSGRIPFEPEQILFNEVVTEIIENYSLIAKTKNISLNYILKGEVSLYADKNMTTAILRNLISNSIKFTNRNGHINIFTEESNENVIITVSDNGVGINSETLHKLFDISQITSTCGTEEEKGTGMGLLLCKQFIEKQGGTIWVESELDKGSDFKFTLPKYSVLKNSN